MTLPFLRAFRLAGEDGGGRNAYLNGDGAFLGDGVALLETEADGAWRPRPDRVLERLLTIGYGDGIDVSCRIDALASVARALNTGDTARAAMTLLHAQLPPLPDADRARKMAEADALLKYSPDEARLPAGGPGGGQWTDGSAGSAARARAPSSAHTVDPTRAKKQRFVSEHLADAQKAADKLGVPVENVLGLTAVESGWGAGRFAVEGNNYLGIEYPAPYATGFLVAKESTARVATFSSYADCLNSFVKSDGNLVQGIVDPNEFASALQNSGKFGIQRDGSKTAGYVGGVAMTIQGLRTKNGR